MSHTIERVCDLQVEIQCIRVRTVTWYCNNNDQRTTERTGSCRQNDGGDATEP